MRARGLIGTAAFVVAMSWAAPAAAEGGRGDARSNGDGIDLEAGNDSGPAPGVGVGKETAAPPPVRCEYAPLDPEDSAIADRLADKGWGNPRGEGEGSWYRQICYLQNGDGAFGDVVWLPARRTVDVQAMADEARDRLGLPAPNVRMSPPVSRHEQSDSLRQRAKAAMPLGPDETRPVARAVRQHPRARPVPTRRN